MKYIILIIFIGICYTGCKKRTTESDWTKGYTTAEGYDYSDWTQEEIDKYFNNPMYTEHGIPPVIIRNQYRRRDEHIARGEPF